MTTNARSAAITGLVLALPGAILISLLMLGIEPPLGPLESLLTNPDPDRPDVGGSLIVLGAMLLLPVAFVINLRVLLRASRAGKSITAHPINLALAVATFGFFALFVGGFVADQYPCWIGVPNCD